MNRIGHMRCLWFQHLHDVRVVCASAQLPTSRLVPLCQLVPSPCANIFPGPRQPHRLRNSLPRPLKILQESSPFPSSCPSPCSTCASPGRGTMSGPPAASWAPSSFSSANPPALPFRLPQPHNRLPSPRPDHLRAHMRFGAPVASEGRQKNVTACLRGTRLLSRAVERNRTGREPRATRANSGDTGSQMHPSPAKAIFWLVPAGRLAGPGRDPSTPPSRKATAGRLRSG
jgi:hypothetical protein